MLAKNIMNLISKLIDKFLELKTGKQLAWAIVLIVASMLLYFSRYFILSFGVLAAAPFVYCKLKSKYGDLKNMFSRIKNNMRKKKDGT